MVLIGKHDAGSNLTIIKPRTVYVKTNYSLVLIKPTWRLQLVCTWSHNASPNVTSLKELTARPILCSTFIVWLFAWQLLPPATKLGQGYVFTGVCHSVNRGGSAHTPFPPGSRHPLLVQTPPPRSRPPRADTPPPGADTPPPGSRHPHPPGSRHPPEHSMLGDTVNARAVRILLECNLVFVFLFDLARFFL